MLERTLGLRLLPLQPYNYSRLERTLGLRLLPLQPYNYSRLERTLGLRLLPLQPYNYSRLERTLGLRLLPLQPYNYSRLERTLGLRLLPLQPYNYSRLERTLGLRLLPLQPYNYSRLERTLGLRLLPLQPYNYSRLERTLGNSHYHNLMPAERGERWAHQSCRLGHASHTRPSCWGVSGGWNQPPWSRTVAWTPCPRRPATCTGDDSIALSALPPPCKTDWRWQHSTTNTPINTSPFHMLHTVLSCYCEQCSTWRMGSSRRSRSRNWVNDLWVGL